MNYLLGEKLHFDWKVVTITIVSTLLLMVDYYHKLTAHKYWDRIVLYLVIPLLIILLLFREKPREYGFSFGDWKAGLLIAALGILIMAPVIYYLGRQRIHAELLQALCRRAAMDYLPGPERLEFFFRGWILFGYARKFGPEAL